LKCGVNTAFPIVKRSLVNSIGRGKRRYSTGELVNSLGISPILYVDGKYDMKIGFSEPRKVQKSRGYKATNAMIANILEYGASSNRHNQPARPWLRPATLQSAQKTTKVMQDELERILKKYFE
jgi:hypothetical protein